MHVIDGHAHMRNLAHAERLVETLDRCGIDQLGLVAIQSPAKGAGLPEPLWLKARHPKRFFVYAGLNHAERLSGGAVKTRSLREQLDHHLSIGCDGVKMIEGKPTSRREFDISLADPYYAPFWERAEELALPIVCHVNDPDTFWDPKRIPGWAAEKNWGYGPEDAQYEALYSEMDLVLERYPKLNLTLPHFYFLSADLPRAERFLQAHPTVNLDLAPGIEMLYNISQDPAAGREFFTTFADRIIFGTDLMCSMTLEEGCARIGMVRRWLETDDTFRVSDEADFLLGPPEDGVIRGMSLPAETLSKIYSANFIRTAGSEPRPLDTSAAADYCRELAALAEAMSGTPAAETVAGQVAALLSG